MPRGRPKGKVSESKSTAQSKILDSETEQLEPSTLNGTERKRPIRTTNSILNYFQPLPNIEIENPNIQEDISPITNPKSKSKPITKSKSKSKKNLKQPIKVEVVSEEEITIPVVSEDGSDFVDDEGPPESEELSEHEEEPENDEAFDSAEEKSSKRKAPKGNPSGKGTISKNKKARIHTGYVVKKGVKPYFYSQAPSLTPLELKTFTKTFQRIHHQPIDTSLVSFRQLDEEDINMFKGSSEKLGLGLPNRDEVSNLDGLGVVGGDGLDFLFFTGLIRTDLSISPTGEYVVISGSVNQNTLSNMPANQIQVWHLAEQKENEMPSLEMILDVGETPINKIEFYPMTFPQGFDHSEFPLTSIGWLSVLFENGIIQLYIIPSPSHLISNPSPPILVNLSLSPYLLLATLTVPSFKITAFGFSDMGLNHLAAGTSTGSILVYDLSSILDQPLPLNSSPTLSPVSITQLHLSQVSFLYFKAPSQAHSDITQVEDICLITIGMDGQVMTFYPYQYSFTPPQLWVRYKHPFQAATLATSFGPDPIVVFSDIKNQLTLLRLDSETDQPVRSKIQFEVSFFVPYLDIATSPYHRAIALAGVDPDLSLLFVDNFGKKTGRKVEQKPILTTAPITDTPNLYQVTQLKTTLPKDRNLKLPNTKPENHHDLYAIYPQFAKSMIRVLFSPRYETRFSMVGLTKNGVVVGLTIS